MLVWLEVSLDLGSRGFLYFICGVEARIDSMAYSGSIEFVDGSLVLELIWNGGKGWWRWRLNGGFEWCWGFVGNNEVVVVSLMRWLMVTKLMLVENTMTKVSIKLWSLCWMWAVGAPLFLVVYSEVFEWWEWNFVDKWMMFTIIKIIKIPLLLRAVIHAAVVQLIL